MGLADFRNSFESINTALRSDTESVLAKALGKKGSSNFKLALKVALADGKVTKEEQAKLDEIKDRREDNDSYKPNRIVINLKSPPSALERFKASLILKDDEFDLYLEIIKLIKQGKKKKAKELLKRLERMHGSSFFIIKDNSSKAEKPSSADKDPLIDAYETATADGSINKAEIKVLKGLVEA